jgi:transposase
MKKSTPPAAGAAHDVTVVGIDLAKNVFAVHGINAGGKPCLVRPNVRRDQLLELLAQLPPKLLRVRSECVTKQA